MPGCTVANVGGADWVELCNEGVDPWPDWEGSFFRGVEAAELWDCTCVYTQ